MNIETPKTGQEKISQREIHHETPPDEKEGKKIPEREISSLDRAGGEIQATENLVRLEDQAQEFSGTIKKLGIPWSADTAGQYENDYALPATVQAETLQGIIVQNNAARNEVVQESKEKRAFNGVSSIMEDKKALCIHIMTGLSNALNDTTRKDAIAPDQLYGLSPGVRKKVEQEALLQLGVLAGLAPSVSASIFSDEHKLEGSWWRGLSQPIGAILREGECVGISSQDAGTRSEKVKARTGEEAVTESQLNRVLSEDDSHFTKSGYNEATISEPKIGALFMPTKGSVSREILETLQGESVTYGYPIFLESNGDFFELSQEDRVTLLRDGDERVSVTDYLRDEKRVSRDEIRRRLEALDSRGLKDKEKDRFDTYLEHYDLKPHFSWSEELAATIDTEIAFHLAQEEQRLDGYEQKLRTESETDGALAGRLFEYFMRHPETKRSYEKIERVYVNGKLYEETLGEGGAVPPPDPDAQVEVRTTKVWEYEEDTSEPSVLIDGVRGVGEISTIQKTRRIRMRIVQSPDGGLFYDTAENTRLLVNKMSAKTGESISSNEALQYLSEETVEKTANGQKKEGGFKKDDWRNVYQPRILRTRNKDSFIDTLDGIRKKIAENVFGADELKQVSMYAKTLAEMYGKLGDEGLKNEWQEIAEGVSPDTNERYAFVRSKLNQDGTLKLDKRDAEEL